MNDTSLMDDSSTVNWMGKCLFCFIHLDTECLIAELLELENVYDSCCRFIRKEDLGEEFFSWRKRNSTQLPICQKCLLCAKKLSKMIAKLEAIQTQIDKLVTRFTEDFLREREENFYFKSETASPLPHIEHHDEPEDPFVSAPDNILLARHVEEERNLGGEEETLFYEDNQEMEGEGVAIKEELDDNFMPGDYSENEALRSNDCCDDETVVNQKPYSRLRKARFNRDRNYVIKDSVKTKSKKMKTEYGKGRMETSQSPGGRHFLPRRTAALKAAKLFSHKEEKMVGESYSNISEGSDYDSENCSNSETGKSRKNPRMSSGRSRANIETCNDASSCVKCKYCKIVFATLVEMESHISIHNEERPFACPKCGFRFTTQSFLIRHLKKHFNEKVFKCAHCKNTYKYMHCLKDHVKARKHHRKTNDQCKLCEKAIAVGKQMQLTRKIDEEYLPLIMSKNSSGVKKEKSNKQAEPCKCESDELLGKEELESLVKKEFGNKMITKSKSIGKNGMKKEVDGKTRQKKLYKCLECNKNCYSKRKLLYHAYSHQPPGTEINCDECCEVFTDILALQSHSSSTHPKAPKPAGRDSGIIQCTVCAKIFSSKGNLNKHMYLHSEVKQFPCPTCPKRFSTKSALTAHSVYHRKDRPYLCEECGQGFHTGTKLREHYRVHTGMLLYCEFCPKGFRNSTHLKQHLRVHNKGGQQQPGEANCDQTEPILMPFQDQSFQNDLNDMNNEKSEEHLDMEMEHSLQNIVSTIP